MTDQQKIPKWASSYISDKMIQKIESKIVEIEHKTTAEVIVLIVKQSSFVQYIKPVLFFILLILNLFTLNWFLHDLWFTALESSIIYLLNIVLMYSFATVLSRISIFQRLFLHPADMQEAFYRRAISEYYENNLYKTEKNTAVLMMVSLLERKAIVLASLELNKELDEKIWTDCINVITQGAKNNDVGLGFLNALEKILPILESKFPLSLNPVNPNEISNSVIIKE
jgi:putative membrane protein